MGGEICMNGRFYGIWVEEEKNVMKYCPMNGLIFARQDMSGIAQMLLRMVRF